MFECGERICYGYKFSFKNGKKIKIEEIIIILSLPLELEIIGSELLKRIANCIINSFSDNLFKIIESEITKFEIVKTQDMIEIIREGDQLKEILLNKLKEICTEYFTYVIKTLDNTKIDSQKALSLLMLKDINISDIVFKKNDNEIGLFKISKIRLSEEEIEEYFSIQSIKIIQDYSEFEILIQNTSKNELNDINFKIIYIINFSEKEIFNLDLEYWLSDEILVFTTPLGPLINDFFIFITDNTLKIKLFSRKIAFLKKLQEIPALDS